MTAAEARTAAAAIAAMLLRGAILDTDTVYGDEADNAAIRVGMVDVAVELYQRAGIRCCRLCACTEEYACEEGCSWIGQDLCSSHPEEPRILVVSG